MKLINKAFLSAAILGALTLTSCGDDDDGGGPSTPAPTGTMEGDITRLYPATPTTGTFTATSVTAEHDTSFFGALTITATSASGETFVFLLNDTAVGSYNFNPASTNFAVYEATAFDTIATTQPDDIDLFGESLGIIQITDNGKGDNRMGGTVTFMRFYEVIEDAEDEQAVIIQNVVFDNVPITRTGITTSTGTVSATINGSAFNPALVQVNSFAGATIITASSLTGTSLSITTPEDPSTGTYDLSNQLSGYSLSYVTTSGGGQVTSGSIVITAANNSENTFSGTFSGSLTVSGNTVNITNGAFSVE